LQYDTQIIFQLLHILSLLQANYSFNYNIWQDNFLCKQTQQLVKTREMIFD